LSFLSGASALGYQDTYSNVSNPEGFEESLPNIKLDEDKLKFVKKVFHSENFYTANV